MINYRVLDANLFLKYNDWSSNMVYVEIKAFDDLDRMKGIWKDISVETEHPKFTNVYVKTINFKGI